MWILVLLAISLFPAYLASKKGRSFILWYVYSIFFFIFAIVHVFFLKDKGIKCSECTSYIPMEANKCKFCGSSIKSDYKESVIAQRKVDEYRRDKILVTTILIVVGYLGVMRIIFHGI